MGDKFSRQQAQKIANLAFRAINLAAIPPGGVRRIRTIDLSLGEFAWLYETTKQDAPKIVDQRSAEAIRNPINSDFGETCDPMYEEQDEDVPDGQVRVTVDEVLHPAVLLLSKEFPTLGTQKLNTRDFISVWSIQNLLSKQCPNRKDWLPFVGTLKKQLDIEIRKLPSDKKTKAVKGKSPKYHLVFIESSEVKIIKNNGRDKIQYDLADQSKTFLSLAFLIFQSVKSAIDENKDSPIRFKLNEIDAALPEKKDGKRQPGSVRKAVERFNESWEKITQEPGNVLKREGDSYLLNCLVRIPRYDQTFHQTLREDT